MKKLNSLIPRALVGVTAVSATTTVVAGVAAVPYVAGFTSAGVAAASSAAAAQAVIGNVVAGSGFAALQSVAATTAVGTCAPLVVAGWRLLVRGWLEGPYTIISIAIRMRSNGTFFDNIRK